MSDYGSISSPAYIIEEAKLIRNLELLQKVQKDAGIDIILALKAYANWQTFPLIKQYLKGATASSLNEAKLILDEMGCKAHTYSPAYLPNEFDDLLGCSSHITFNSLNQFEQHKQKAIKAGVSIGLRINPEYSDVETDLYNPCAEGSRLGVLAEKLLELPQEIDGFHSHTLCESDSFAVEKVLQNIEAKFGKHLPNLKWLNLGGGHLMTKKGYNIEHLIQVLKAFKMKFPNLAIILEPGSAIAWQTGVLKSTVLDVVENKGIKTAILDVSFTCHMPDVLEMPYRPTITGATDYDTGKFVYRLGGVSCLAGDFIAEYSFEKELNIGSTVIFEDMIHYTTVKTTQFNGVSHPSIVLLKQNKKVEVLKDYSYPDFKNRL